MKCKVINTSKLNLEYETNEWLKTGNYEFVSITQTESADNGYITLTIFYLELKEIRFKKLQKIKNNNL